MERQAREPGPYGQGGGVPPTGRTPRRRAVEDRSAPFLLRIRRAPRWLIPLVPVALLLAGLAAPAAIGGPALLLLVLLLGWLAYLSWPHLGETGRLLRVAALVLLLGLSVSRLIGTF